MEEENRKILEQEIVFCKRTDPIGARKFWQEVAGLIEDGFVYLDSTSRMTCPLLGVRPRVTLVKYEEPAKQGKDTEKPKRKSQAKKKAAKSEEAVKPAEE